MSPPSDAEVRDARPTHVRHVVVAVATLMSVLLYLDRNSLGIAADFIREDLHLTQSQISWLVSGFFWTYALAQVPSGWLSDRFGPRLMLVLYILSWSFFTAMTGLSYTFPLLLLMRFGIGLAQAGAYPSCGTLLGEWIPPSSRATASAFVAFGGRVGGALAPLLTPLLIVMCLPGDTPVLFQARDLLDPEALCRKLDEGMKALDTPVPTPATTVAGLLSDEARAVVAEAAARRGAEKPTTPGLSEAAKDALVVSLNAIMGRDVLYDPVAFGNVNLNRQATGDARRLQAGQSLDPARRLLFHRFLLESSFPTELAKYHTPGWRPVMVGYGLAGILVAGIFWFYFRDAPHLHPGCNARERAIIAEGRAPAATHKSARQPFPLMVILTDFSSWCMSLLQFGTNVGWLFVINYYPRYLFEVHNVPAITRGFLASVPMWVGMAGLLVGGRLTDWLTARVGLGWGRRLPIVATRFVGATGYGLALLFSSFPADSPFQSPWAYAVAFSFVTLGVDMGIASTWAFMQDVGGKNVGAILGWGNMWGNFGAALAPLFYNRILGEKPTLADWNHIFLFCLAACVLSGVGALGIDATRPLSTAKSEDAPESDPA